VFTLGELTFEDFVGDDYTKAQVSVKAVDAFKRTYDEIWGGDISRIANLPVESFIPLLFVSHLSRFA